jgi:hypothetical protein
MKKIYEDGFFLYPLKEAGGVHIIGGVYEGAGAISPNSQKPLVQLASIYVADGLLNFGAWPLPVVPLLYSWTCAICEGTFSYRQFSGYIEIVEYVQGNAYADFPYAGYPVSFPEVPVDLIGLSGDEVDVIRKLNSANDDSGLALRRKFPMLSMPRHQVGGEPYFVSGEILSSRCPCCREEMSFFASIANDSFSPDLEFAGNDFAQLLYEICIHCCVISVSNYVD